MSALLFAQLEGAGPAIIVSCSLAVLGIVGFFFVSYFAHCFLTVVIDSAAGVDEIRFPSESIVDWMTKPVYLLWVVLPLLFIPCLTLAFGGGAVAFLVTLLVLLWLVSPIMFLSSLAAKSWMSLFYGPFLKRWARFFFAYVVFLIWSGLLTALGTALLVAALWSLKGVVVAMIALPAVFLLYFRVLGRYAWYVTTRRMRRPKKRQVNPAKGLKVESLDPWAAPPAETTTPAEPRHDEPADSADSVNETESTAMRDKFAPAETSYKLAPADSPVAGRPKLAPADQPRTRSGGEGGKLAAADEPIAPAAMPAVEDEWTPNKKPYGVMTEQQARQSWVERTGTPGDSDGYGVETMSLGPPVSLWHYYEERHKQEEELREQGKAVRQYERPRKPPTLWQAMTKEIWGFLIYGHTLRTWINLAILFGVELTLLNLIAHMTGLLFGR
ncbi:MAG: hypothetical protein L0Y71_09900 [Gemmataceae bacterium]|nr:hypothetical protein [Gemmataceae bacterium]